MQNEVIYRQASLSDLEQIWDASILAHPDEPEYIRWKDQFIADNVAGRSKSFVIDYNGQLIGEGTLLLSPECEAIRGRMMLSDRKTIANINALRIQKAYESRGYISGLMRYIEDAARQDGYRSLSIGVEAKETRNLAIYLHWGYDEFIWSEIEDDELILYYAKAL